MSLKDYFDRRVDELTREATARANLLGIPVTNNNPHGHDDARDAFRHAFISAMLTQEFGSAVAQFGGDLREHLHPALPPNTAAEYNMDQWNNQVGRAIGSIPVDEFFGDPRDQIAQRVYEALQNGELIDRLSDPRQFTGDDYVRDEPDNVPVDPRGLMELEGWMDPFQQAGAAVPYTCPIVLDLDGDGVETVSGTTGVFFDHDGNGFAEQTNWVGADDGILALDRNGDGRINNGTELFGNQTVLSTGGKANNGYEALAELDDNRDGRIDQQDAAYSSLRIWRDADGDGYSHSAELRTLQELDVASINVSYSSSTYVDSLGNPHRQISAYSRSDGSSGATADVWFQTSPSISIQETLLPVSTAVLQLPYLEGSGNVADLHQAMMKDASGGLRSLVQTFSSETDIAERNGLLEQMLYAWTGSTNIDPTSRGSTVDARKLAVLEAFAGRAFVGADGGSNPNTAAAPLLNQSYAVLSEFVYSQLMLQTHFDDIHRLIAYRWDASAEMLKANLVPAADELANRYDTDAAQGEVVFYEFLRTIKGLNAPTTYDINQFRVHDRLSWLLDVQGITSTEGSDQNESLMGTAGQDAIHAGQGDDTLTGNGGNDVLYGGIGNDTINAGSGNDILYGGDGNDTITDAEGSNTIDGGAGDDSITVNSGNSSQSNVLRGGAGNDTILQANIWGLNTFDGGAGDDVLGLSRAYAGSGGGSSTFIGGVGNDRMEGYSGSDTYIFNRGDGQDVINDYAYAAWSYTDTVRFGAGITQANLAFSKSGNHLVIAINDPANPGATDQITIENWFISDLYRIETFSFPDGTSLSKAKVHSIAATVTGTAGDDTLAGWNENNTIHGLEGNDTITGGGGNDTIHAGAGNDTVTTGSGNDTVYGGDGNDTLTDAEGSNTIDGGAGDDSITVTSGNSAESNTLRGGDGNDTILQENVWGSNLFEGGAGNDTLRLSRAYTGGGSATFIGGLGNDRMEGYSGSDTYIFNRGDGQDVINDYAYAAWSYTDTVRFGSDITKLDLVFARVGNNLVVSDHRSDDEVTVENWYVSNLYKMEKIRTSSSEVLVSTQVEQLIQAMAQFSANNGGMTWDQAIDQRPDDVLQVIAAHWQPA
jgi:Ca2+-binding RTX toxin-like protein